jgi:hypothetical protein
MIEIVKINEDLPQSSANALHAVCTEGRQWVLRLKKREKNARRLVNEFLAAGLACEVGIRRPSAEVALVSSGIIPARHQDLFGRANQFGIAIEFLNNIRHVSPPCNYNPCLPDFAVTNKLHLNELLKTGDNLDQFYGYHVFTNWIQLQDGGKYENLMIDENGHFVFLDMDFAFGGADNECEMQDYNWYSIRPVAPFLEGIITEKQLYERWLERINGVSIELFRELVSQIEGRLEFSPSCVERIEAILFDQREQFLSEFASALSE